MDLSKVPDAQRQQLEQLQKQFQEHQKKQQEDSASAAAAAAAAAAVQQQQPPPPSAYDPSQVHHQSYDPSQGYDQSYYYNYNHHEQQQPQQQQHSQPPQYDASYYQNYHPNAYPQQPQPQPQQQQHQYTHSEAYPVVVPSEQQQQRNEGSVSSGLGLGHVQDQYVDPNNHHQVNSQANAGYPVPPGLNAAAAAAVAALSQLTQFAGSMGAAERAMSGGGYGPPMGGGGGHYGQGHFRPPAGHSPYRGGGRRGGGPFRGGGRGFRPPGSGGSGPSFHGRGRGRGSGRGGRGRGGRHDQSLSSHPETSAVEEAKPSEGAEPSAQANPQQPIRIAWCELCRVDCTSKEILEQHKNGKRHKKNLHMKGGAHQPASETQKDENATTDNNISEQEAADKQTKVGTTDDDNNKVETEGNEGQEKKPWMNTKRKMRGGGRGGGRGAKRQRQVAMGGPPKPKIVIPLMCDLCNVKCDTQEVFDRHVGGKKHVAKLKRFEGHQAMYGPTAVQALYPPNPLSQTMGGPQQPAYYPATAAAASDAYVAPAPPPSQAQQNPNPQLADAPLEFGTKNEAPQVTATGV
ncbi:hypothetical protein OSB04_010859 [Centaurea solstitialis]|uniref:U1-type domain-containing protein n=1 Tax=Centaurea solstitialis TaxID=347529 RepID=A0AA38T8C7_9ASTR|nr:hypothetical protein OSB04_010859 [Centaurea solstitialis]